MNGINIYARTAKYVLVGLFLIFAVVCLILFFAKDHSAIKNLALLIFGILFIPVSSTAVHYFFEDPLEKEMKNIGFVADKKLEQKLESLLQSVNSSVKVGSYASDALNAFAISSVLGKKSIVGFSTKLISDADDAQFLAIAAHEIAHLKNGDSQNKIFILAFNHALQIYPYIFSEMSKTALKAIFMWGTIIAVVCGAITALVSGTSIAFTLVRDLFLVIFRMGWWLPLVILGFIALRHFLLRAFFAYSREREFAADAEGAAMTSHTEMISALDLLTDTADVLSIFDTHPPLDERKKRLREQMRICTEHLPESPATV